MSQDTGVVGERSLACKLGRCTVHHYVVLKTVEVANCGYRQIVCKDGARVVQTPETLLHIGTLLVKHFHIVINGKRVKLNAPTMVVDVDPFLVAGWNLQGKLNP